FDHDRDGADVLDPEVDEDLFRGIVAVADAVTAEDRLSDPVHVVAAVVVDPHSQVDGLTAEREYWGGCLDDSALREPSELLRELLRSVADVRVRIVAEATAAGSQRGGMVDGHAAVPPRLIRHHRIVAAAPDALERHVGVDRFASSIL